MNQIIVYGRVISIDENRKEFVVSVPRTYLSYQGDYIEDKLLCSHFNNINKNMTSYICIDDSILIKGRLETRDEKCCIIVESYKVLKRKV